MGGITPCTSTWWSLSSQAESLQERPWWRCRELWQQGRPRKVLFLCSALARHTLSVGSSAGLLSRRRWEHTRMDPAEATRMARGWREAQPHGPASLERGGIQGDSLRREGKASVGSCCNLQWEVVEKMEPNSSLGCKEIGQEAAEIRCNTEHTQQISGRNYHLKVVRHRVQESVSLSSPETSKTWLGKAGETWSKFGPTLSRKLGDPRDLFHPELFWLSDSHLFTKLWIFITYPSHLKHCIQAPESHLCNLL